jgi:putative transposase
VVEITNIETKTDNSVVVGIDVGLKDFAITSDGEIIKNPKFLRKSEKKLKAAQRKLSRKKLGSNNRNKARLKVARIHNKIKNQRKDFINQVSSSITKNYDLVVMENINVVGLMKNHCLAKSIADASWSMFTETMKWHCLKRGKSFHQVGMFFPSSKTCNSCGENKTDLTLSDRIFKCENCGFEIDRDVNAALNLRDQGIKEHNTVGTTEINA